jgi:hypothetical protein
LIKTLPAHLTHEMCSCGHMGGHSPNRNSHATRFQLGHGYCTVEGCSCNQFTWIGFCTKKGDIE